MSALRVACVQLDVDLGNPLHNAERAVREMEHLATRQVEFAVFPECFLTGYSVGSREEAEEISIRQEHEAIRLVEEASHRLGITVVMGYAGVDDDGRLYNGAFISVRAMPTFRFEKVHLPEMGLDKWVESGDKLEVFTAKDAKVGVLICYDMRPPEATRCLALEGADLIALPTNWPEGAETSAEHICIARAAENRVFFATCNRVGTERGFRFIGRSKIIDVTGKVLAAAGDGEETIVADLDLEQARMKRTVNIPGKYELDLFGSRKPELYGAITRS